MNINEMLASTASAQSQMQFQERMSNTAHQREVEDLKAAGLNPVLSAGGQGASTPNGAEGDFSQLIEAIASGQASTGKALISAVNSLGKMAASSMFADRRNAAAAGGKGLAATASGGGAQDIVDKLYIERPTKLWQLLWNTSILKYQQTGNPNYLPQQPGDYHNNYGAFEFNYQNDLSPGQSARRQYNTLTTDDWYYLN